MESPDIEDVLPGLLESLGPKGFMEEVLKEFDVLADPSTHTITLHSLKRSATVLGLQHMSEEEMEKMIADGDADGDGALNHYEFCIQIIKCSPSMRSHAQDWLEEILLEDAQEFATCQGQCSSTP